MRSDSNGHCGSEASVARLRVHARDVSVGRRLADLGQGERQVRWRVDGSRCPVSQQYLLFLAAAECDECGN